MKNLLKKTKLSVILSSALTIVLGIILIANPIDSTLFICRSAGFILLIAGLFTTGSYFLNISENVGNSSLITGLVQLSIGAFVILNPEKTVQFLTFIIGFVILVHSFSIFQSAFEVKRCGYKTWWVIVIFAAVLTVLGITVAASPFGTVAAAMTVAGICLIADGIMGIIISLRVEKFVKNLREAAQQAGISTIETTGEEVR